MEQFYRNHIALIHSYRSNYIRSSFDVERADTLFRNAKQYPNKRAELLKDAFRLCPWNDALQEYIFMNCPEEREAVFEAAKRFGKGFGHCVEKLLCQEYKQGDTSTEAQTLIVKKENTVVNVYLQVADKRCARSAVARLLTPSLPGYRVS